MPDWSVAHTRAYALEDIAKYQGSKYVQSDISKCFDLLREDLFNGKCVLFTGTPCQVDAVNNFIRTLPKFDGHIFTMEVLCYGVPSPLVFQDYIHYLEHVNGRIVSYCFRDEREGWGNRYIHSAQLENKSELYDTKILRAFSSLYSSHHTVRESCFSCKYSCCDRSADITVGDCWGIDNIMPEMHDKFGTSQVWVNTQRGQELWREVKNDFCIAECDIAQIIPYNRVLCNSPERPSGQKLFWLIYKKLGFVCMMRIYSPLGCTFPIRYKIVKIFKKLLNWFK